MSENIEAGFISLWRKIREHRLWPGKTKRKFTEFEALVDLLLSANHEDREIGNLIIRRGEHLTSMLKLSKRWKWSREKVKNFLKSLDLRHEARHTITTKYTIISICKYDNYQLSRICRNYDSDTRTDIKPTSNRHQTDTNNNYINNINNVYTPKKKSVSNSDHKNIIEYFCNQYKNKFGRKYIFQDAKDGKLIKRLLKNFGFDDLCRIIDAFFNTEDKFIQSTAYEIGVLSNQINKVAMEAFNLKKEAVASKPPATGDEPAKEEAQWSWEQEDPEATLEIDPLLKEEWKDK